MICDAHCHYHDARLAALHEDFAGLLTQHRISGAVVNGTRESDWPAVEALCEAHPSLRPAFGLHPWWIPDRSAGWEKTLTAFLARHPRATLGETGLDCWIEGHDIEDQKRVFARQLAIARECRCAITVHCLRAHEPLRQVLQKEAAPPGGFLLHAYAGSTALVPWLLEKGAHFSFPPYFLHARKAPQREMFRTLPEDRILLETDAPDLVPPDDYYNRYPLTAADGTAVNHPAQLHSALHGLAEIREIPADRLAELTSANWQRLFG
jgi:TatD DNase family protein